MILNADLENGKVALIREILGIQDIQDVELLNEFNQELKHSFEFEAQKEETGEMK